MIYWLPILAVRLKKGENIDGKSDKEKIDLLKNIISDMVTQKDREDIIKGKNNGESQWKSMNCLMSYWKNPNLWEISVMTEKKWCLRF